MNEESTRPFYMLFFIGLLPFIMVIGNSMFIPLLPQMQVDLGLSTIEGGWLLTSFSIPAALLVPLGGILSDRYGRKMVALIALPTIMIGCAISALAVILVQDSSFYLLLVGRFLQGVGAGSVTPLAMAFISDLYAGKQRTEALGTIEVFNGAGKVISPIVGGMILLLNWSLAFVVFFAVSLFAFTGIVLFIRGSKRISLEHKGLREMGKQFNVTFREHWRWLVPILLSGGIGMFLLFGYLVYLSNIVEIDGGFSSTINGVLLAIPLFMLTIFSYFTGRRLRGDATSYKTAMIYGSCLMIIGTSSMIISGQVVVVLVAMSIYATGFGILLPAANSALAMIVSAKERGTIFATYSMVRFLGVAFGPLLFGYWMVDLEQLRFTSLFFVSMIGLSLLCSWSCLPIGKKCYPTFGHLD